MWHWGIYPGRNYFGGWKTWNFVMGGKFSNENPKSSFRQMPQQKAWGILQGSFDRREMVKGGETFSHKCSRTSGIKVCNPNIHKEFVTLDHSCSSRQQSCSGISLDGWYPQCTTSKAHQVNLKLYAVLSDPNYSRVLSEQVECQSRLKVQECNRLIWLETSSESLSKNNQTLRNPNSRSICLQAVSPTSPIYGMEAKCLVLHSQPSFDRSGDK